MSGRNPGLILSAILVSGQLAPLPLPAISVTAAAAQDVRTVRCEPRGNNRRECTVPSGARSIRYIGNDSRGACRPGQTFGLQSSNRMWVSNGCGGTFQIDYRNNSGWNNGWNNGWGDGGNNGWNTNAPGGEIRCESSNNREKRCRVDTGGRVALSQQLSSQPCIEGQSWRYDRDSIYVRNGCRASFRYGNAAGGGSGWNDDRGFAGQMECRSENNRSRQCSVQTQNRVVMLRELKGNCVEGRSWGYDSRRIWVNNGCQARFGYGYGNVEGDRGGGGSNVGGIIAGAAIAAGLIAILASSGKKGSKDIGQSATISADYGHFPAVAREDAKLCLEEAARQVAATGGTRVTLHGVNDSTRSGDGWKLQARLVGTYDGQSQSIVMDCRTDGRKVVQFDIR